MWYKASAGLTAWIIGCCLSLQGISQVNAPVYGLVIHGGAGSSLKGAGEAKINAYKTSLERAVFIGDSILAAKGSALDAVEQVIRYLENDSLFNAGKGAVLNENCDAVLDASIMSGKDLSAGAVAGVEHIKNPISAARVVMEKSPHVLLIAEGAEKLAFNHALDSVPNAYFITQANQFDCAADQMEKKLEEIYKSKGTVGCVALDQDGNIVAGTSTGGVSGKMEGRIGDSPVIGAGTYANNLTCGISCTGKGELFIKHYVAARISAKMELAGMSLEEALASVINELPQWAGGAIGIDAKGNISVDYNTPGMFYGYKASDGRYVINAATE